MWPIHQARSIEWQWVRLVQPFTEMRHWGRHWLPLFFFWVRDYSCWGGHSIIKRVIEISKKDKPLSFLLLSVSYFPIKIFSATLVQRLIFQLSYEELVMFANSNRWPKFQQIFFRISWLRFKIKMLDTSESLSLDDDLQENVVDSFHLN